MKTNLDGGCNENLTVAFDGLRIQTYFFIFALFLDLYRFIRARHNF